MSALSLLINLEFFGVSSSFRFYYAWASEWGWGEWGWESESEWWAEGMGEWWVECGCESEYWVEGMGERESEWWVEWGCESESEWWVEGMGERESEWWVEWGCESEWWVEGRCPLSLPLSLWFCKRHACITAKGLSSCGGGKTLGDSSSQCYKQLAWRKIQNWCTVKEPGYTASLLIWKSDLAKVYNSK